jgi:hypothetical protein
MRLPLFLNTERQNYLSAKVFPFHRRLYFTMPDCNWRQKCIYGTYEFLISFFQFAYWGRGGVHTESTRHVSHFWPIVPAPRDREDREFGGMKIGRGNLSTRRKPALAPLCPPQIPLDQTQARTRTAAMGSQRLTASAMVRPWHLRKVIQISHFQFAYRATASIRQRDALARTSLLMLSKVPEKLNL